MKFLPLITYILTVFIFLNFSLAAQQNNSEPTTPAAKKPAPARIESSGATEEDQFYGKWEDEDISRVFPELDDLADYGTEESLKKLQGAEQLFKDAIATLEMGKVEVKELKADSLAEKHQYDWQRIDANKKFEQKRNEALRRSRTNAIGNLIKAIKLLDDVKNRDIKGSKRFVDSKSKIYIELIKLQFRNKNFKACIPLVEEYLELKPEHQKNYEPYRILASSYRHQEELAKKSRDSQAILFFRKRKNQALKRFSELKNGPNSDEHRAILKQISSEELSATNLP